MRRSGARLHATVMAVALCLFAHDARAQSVNPAPLAEPSNRHVAEMQAESTGEQDGDYSLPPVERENNTGASDGFPVVAYLFEGNNVVATEVLRQIAEAYVGRSISYADLEELRQKLSQAYVDRGYVNSGATLPPDFYRDGTVTFRIVEGRITELRASGLGRLHSNYLRQRLLNPDEPFNANALQNSFQLLLTDPLFSKLDARLLPGESAGEAVLEMDVTRARPWDVSVYANNYHPPSVGAEAIGIAAAVHNITGIGDVISGSIEHGRDRIGRYTIDWNVPVTYGTDIHAHYEHGDSSVLQEPLSSLDVGSLLNSYEIGISRALVQTIEQRVAVGIAYVYRQNDTTLLGSPFSFVPGEPTGTSVVRDWRLEQEWVRRWERQTLAVRSTFTVGDTNTTPSSDPNVPPQHYLVWLGQLQFARQIAANGTTASLRLAMQWAHDRLVPLEQFSIGGVYSVRGYPENQLVRDQGYNFSVEMRYPLFRQPEKVHQLSLVPFFDYGEAWNRGEDHEQLSSIGLGLTWQLGGLSAEVYYGTRLVDVAIDASGALENAGVHVQVRYAF